MDDQDYEYDWISAARITPELLAECAELFSSQYGNWSPKGPRPGKNIRLSVEALRPFLPQGSAACLARRNGQLVGHAFVLRASIPNRGVVSWVTQLVVHRDHRERGIAKELLFSAWCFSNHFAWGLITSNPYAVRALERQTHRRCDPRTIRRFSPELLALGAHHIDYVRGKSASIDESQSIIDTQFHIDHSKVREKIQRVTRGSVPWTLGVIDEGEEWFAFTFRDQPQFPLETAELERLLARSEETVRRAYERMVLDPQKHKWLRHTDKEIEFAEAVLDLSPGARVLDLGCGQGRHACALARRGYEVTGIDFVTSFIDLAARNAAKDGIASARFVAGDGRAADLGGPFDAAICLYDVIGSFPDQASNQALLDNLSRHLRSGGKALASVLNMERTAHVARHRVILEEDPNALLRLAASRTMEQTGDIFDPDLFVLDPQRGIVYRREQFDAEDRIPMEVIVRDRRYTRTDVREMCERAGLRLIWARCVKAGRWDEELGPIEEGAKEVLFLAEKR